MKKQEVVKLFMAIAKLFPRDNAFIHADQQMVEMWAEMLEDITFEQGMRAVKAAVSTSPFPPSIAEIRDYATRLNGPRRMTAEEAWGQACDVIKTYGTKTVLREGAEEKEPKYTDMVVETRVYKCVTPRGTGRQYEAELHCDPEVWKLLKNMGYKQVVESDNPDVVRGQFMRAWQGHDTEAKERRVISTIVPELFDGGDILSGLLGGGQNGEDI